MNLNFNNQYTNQMEKGNPTEGRIVTFTPSDSTKMKEFKNVRKNTYPAIIAQVNKASVDLTVFGVGETIYMQRIKHKSEADIERSSWDWPTQK